jgi:small neutral amino acid transporter SnatA (MarC family)
MKHATRSARQRKQLLLRAGVWIFLILFAFTIVGGALFAVGTLR